MKQINRKVAMLLSLCILVSFGGCGKITGDVSGRKDIPAEKEGSIGEGSPLDDMVSPNEKLEDGLMQSLAATVQIFADNFQGSGVIYAYWENSVVLVTAAHVIPPECKEIKIIFEDGEEAVCTNYQLMEDVDCAFMILGEESLPKAWQEKYGVVKRDREKFDAMQSDEGVFLADYQAENDLGCRFAMIIESWIYVEDFATHMMLLSGEAHGGMSGCGVFEENGCFLGILCGGNEKGELAVLPYSLIEANFTKTYLENR